MILLHRVLNICDEGRKIADERPSIDIRESHDVRLQRLYQCSRGVNRCETPISIRDNAVIGELFGFVEESPANRGRKQISRTTCQESVTGRETLHTDDDVERVTDKIEVSDPLPVTRHPCEHTAVRSSNSRFKPIFAQSLRNVSGDNNVDSLLFVDCLQVSDDCVDLCIDRSGRLAVEMKGCECSVNECRSCHETSMQFGPRLAQIVELNR